jgi:hypothetical protein
MQPWQSGMASKGNKKTRISMTGAEVKWNTADELLLYTDGKEANATSRVLSLTPLKKKKRQSSCYYTRMFALCSIISKTVISLVSASSSSRNVLPVQLDQADQLSGADGLVASKIRDFQPRRY